MKAKDEDSGSARVGVQTVEMFCSAAKTLHSPEHPTPSRWASLT